MKFLLYGANGYTGRLIAETASDYGLKPVLAGRSENLIRPLAEELGLDYRIFDLGDPSAIDRGIGGFKVVLHAAGPFIFTAKPMIEACIRNKAHYLDITGEIAVFEMAARYGPQAEKAGVMLMPGVGFDVVPTDCMALFLKKQLPNATHLQLAFTTLGGGLSHGTATTMAVNLGSSGAVRKDGKIVKVPMGHKAMTVPFDRKPRFAMAIPWGDVSTAFYSTGIPNIETYTGVKPSSYRFVKLQRFLGWILRTSIVKNLVIKQIKKRPAGPSPEQRQQGQSLVWGKVWNAAGEIREATMRTPEGYTLTAVTSLIITRKVLNGDAPAGFQTPAKAYGENLIMEVEGTVRSLKD